MRRTGAILAGAAILVVAGAAALWFASAPARLSAAEVAAAPPGDAARGEQVFWAGGCASCHAAAGAEGDARFRLAGGVSLATPFGTFVAPNISPDPKDGIGGWSFADFANAMMRGVAPDGSHLYPAFPYPSYARMTIADVADLHAFLKTLPAVEGRAPAHRLGFPFNVRRGLGLWKRAFLHPDPVVQFDAPDERLARGRYLVEGPGHCGECHTPRNLAGAADMSRWLAGAPAAAGSGKVPNITPGGSKVGGWSEDEIAEFLSSGFTPDFDSAGGTMAEVVRNLAELPAGDRSAIAAYLKAMPAVPD
jgi:mono/diheme cytochrome c family protein